MEAYWTTKELADLLHTSTTHIVRMIDAGKLPAINLGLGQYRELRVPRAAVEQALAGLTVVPPKASPRKAKSAWPRDVMRILTARTEHDS